MKSIGIPTGLGSNNWAVSGDLTLTGKPILCGDPHLDITTLPGYWYEIIYNGGMSLHILDCIFVLYFNHYEQSLSLSLSLYIYIYIYMSLSFFKNSSSSFIFTYPYLPFVCIAEKKITGAI